jgi:hypothetical protein
MAKKKKAKPASETPAERSQIIELCVIYVQSLAAYDAGFSVDRTGDSDYASAGNHIRKARAANRKQPSQTGCSSPHCIRALCESRGSGLNVWGAKRRTTKRDRAGLRPVLCGRGF